MVDFFINSAVIAILLILGKRREYFLQGCLCQAIILNVIICIVLYVLHHLEHRRPRYIPPRQREVQLFLK